MLRQSPQGSVDHLKDMGFCSVQARKPREDSEQRYGLIWLKYKLYVAQLYMLVTNLLQGTD